MISARLRPFYGFIFMTLLVVTGTSAVGAEFVPVCKRSKAMVKALELKFRTSCDLISQADLFKLAGFGYRFDLQGGELLPGDLNGFLRLSSVEIWGISNHSISPGLFEGLDATLAITVRAESATEILPGAFADLKSLKILTVVSKRFEKVDPHAFEGLDHLEVLNLQGEMETIDPVIFVPLKAKLRAVEIGGFQAEELKWGLFDGLPALRNLRIHAPHLQSIADGYFAGHTQLELVVLAAPLQRTTPAAFRGLRSAVLPKHFGVENFDVRPWNF